MSEWLDSVQGLAVQVIVLCGAVILVVQLLVRGYRPARQGIDWAETLNTIVAGQEEQSAVNAIVRRELTKNGGGSMLDKVDQIYDRLTASCPLWAEGKCQLWRPAGHPVDDCPVSSEGAA